MKKILLLVILLVILTACNTQDKTFENCVLNYDETDAYCTTEEMVKGFNEVVYESGLVSDKLNFTSVVMVSEDLIHIVGSKNSELNNENIESLKLLLEYVSSELESTNYIIEILMSNISNDYIFAINNNETIGIVVIELIGMDLSDNDISSLNELLESSGFTDKRIRYGHAINGDDIKIDNKKFIFKSSNYEKIKYFADELIEVYSNYEIVVEE